MLSRCPKAKSCGGEIPLWTDSIMPLWLGKVTTVDVYGVVEDNCKYLSRQVQVMRCNYFKEPIFIYKYVGNYALTCSETFCGEDKQF